MVGAKPIKAGSIWIMSNTTNKEKAGQTEGFGLLFSCSISVLLSHCIVSRTVFPEYHCDPAAGFYLVFHANVGIVPLGDLLCNKKTQSRSLGIGGSAGGVETVNT